jgi:hypothetical protein
MVEFLTDEWVAALDGITLATPPERRIVVEQRVIDVRERADEPAQHDVVWHVIVDGPVVRVVNAPASDADITFTQDRETAVAIATGALNAQLAFIEGRVRLTGDVRVVIDHADVFEQLDAAWKPLSARTTYA